MSSSLRDVMIYILKNYPNYLADELSNARLTKMVYLVDWEHAKRYGKQVTTIEWYFDTYGPFVKDIENLANDTPDVFKIQASTNVFGEKKRVLRLKNKSVVDELSNEQKSIVGSVIERAKDLYWDGFIKWVYSTYPIRHSERYTVLDLKGLAKQFNEEKKREKVTA